MHKTTVALATPLREQLDRLASFQPVEFPVLSVYLDMRADQHGKRTYEPFLRKMFPERSRTLKGPARESFERDAQRIREFLATDLRESTQGVALFACAAAGDFFEALQFEASIDQHWLFIGAVPHLYLLARINDQYPRYAALLLDTNSARLFVFSLGGRQTEEQIVGTKTRKSSMGGWSQARYQRRIENVHLHHMKEVVAALDRVVRDEAISQIVFAADEVARPVLMEQLPKHLATKVIDVLALDIHTPEHAVLSATLDSLRQRDAETDAERVQAMLDQWRAGGLAVAGPDDTLQALTLGEVEEVLIAATPGTLRPGQPSSVGDQKPHDVETSAPQTGFDAARVTLAAELVARAQQSAVRIRFIEDAALLADIGGVGAILRFKI